MVYKEHIIWCRRIIYLLLHISVVKETWPWHLTARKVYLCNTSTMMFRLLFCSSMHKWGMSELFDKTMWLLYWDECIFFSLISFLPFFWTLIFSLFDKCFVKGFWIYFFKILFSVMKDIFCTIIFKRSFWMLFLFILFFTTLGIIFYYYQYYYFKKCLTSNKRIF